MLNRTIMEQADRAVAEIDSASLASNRTELYALAIVEERERCLRAVAEQRCERGTPWDLAIVTCMNAIKPGSAVWDPAASNPKDAA
jgi:hypothetical protein